MKLNPESQHHHDGTEQQDHSYHRAIARIVFAQIEPTDLALLPHVEQATKQPALAAARAATSQGDTQ